MPYAAGHQNAITYGLKLYQYKMQSKMFSNNKVGFAHIGLQLLFTFSFQQVDFVSFNHPTSVGTKECAENGTYKI